MFVLKVLQLQISMIEHTEYHEQLIKATLEYADPRRKQYMRSISSRVNQLIVEVDSGNNVKRRILRI